MHWCVVMCVCNAFRDQTCVSVRDRHTQVRVRDKPNKQYERRSRRSYPTAWSAASATGSVVGPPSIVPFTLTAGVSIPSQRAQRKGVAIGAEGMAGCSVTSARPPSSQTAVLSVT